MSNFKEGTAVAKVSIIVPVYNCADFLPRCLESLQNQTFTDCQFVIVDDSSTDGSSDIINRFAECDSRFTVITQPNGGVSAARNTGLAAADSEYIAFVDADDYVVPEFIATLLTAVEKYNADIAMCDYDKVFKTKTDSSVLALDNDVWDTAGSWWLGCVTRSPELWNKLYRRSVIEAAGASFMMNSGEDYMFNTAVATQVKKAVTIKASLYRYVQRKNSIMRTAVASDESYTFINAFVDVHAGNEVYINMAFEAEELLCAYAFTALMHSAEAIGKGTGFYKNQLKVLSVWDGYRTFCKSMAKGTALAEMTAIGSVGKKFAALMRPVFLPASLGFNWLTAAMLPAVQRMIQKRKRGDLEDLI